MQPGNPGQDPYGQQPSDPNAAQRQDPYAQPPQPTSGQPYGQPTSGQPYGQPQYQDAPQPYQDPYGQQPMPGQPYGAAPGYQTPGYGPVGGQNNTLGLVAMIVGIISIPAACCAALGILAGIAGVVLGILGRGKVSRGEASNGGQALAGLICGAIGLLLGVVNLILAVVMNANGFTYMP
ncbi:hypothetical protein ABNF97_16025 [Plantactinospora sp. B6F1]|uniref:DUF4190 domain-containing protein n=1 Tax=Plantactinospora sp. B6F1 TaxID=3158971 RepID=UPI0032D9ACEC